MKQHLLAKKASRIQKHIIRTIKKIKHSIKQKKKAHRERSPFSFVITTKLKYFFLGGIFFALFIFIPLITFILFQTLPNPIQLSLNQIPQTTKIFDRHGILLYQFYATQNRTIIPLSDIPKQLQEATIAIEDKNFYKNPGVDITAIVRAAIANVSHNNIQGGSTITQQLIKSSLLTPERSISRKIEEIILAFWAERLYSKDKILGMYFNQVPYGGTAWGIEAASQTYFGKRTKNLDLAESAFLAGLPQAPTEYSPYGTHPNLWKARQSDVLHRMQELGYITKSQEKQAENEQLQFNTPQVPLLAPHFVMYIKDLLTQQYGLPLVEKGGLQVYTTLDLPLQQKAQSIVQTEVTNDQYLNLTNGAALVTNPQNGDILAMVGSSNYDNPQDGNVNVTTSLRQPGSSIKIVTYAAALSHGFTAATLLDDSPVSFPLSDGTLYSPVNYDGKFHGKVPLRIAFGNSFNIPAVKTLNAIGVDTFIDLAEKMGIDTLATNTKQYGLSITLGGMDTTMLDMATVYGTIANQGTKISLNPIMKITDSKGTLLVEKKPTSGNNIVDTGIAYILSNILSDNLARVWEFGNNSPLVIPNHTVAVKTGTSDDKRDNWTIGFVPSRVVTVWVGNDDNSPMSPDLASGITGAAPIWHNIMTEVLNDPTTNSWYEHPSDIIAKPCLGKTEYFLSGTENTANCNPLPTWTPTPTQ